MQSIKFLGLAALLLASVPAHAQSAGSWRIDGAVSGRTFKLDCQLQPAGGICVEAQPGGKRYALTGYSANGDQATWTFKTKVVFIGVTMTFAGRVAGNRMSGTLSAAGRAGSFTAVRR